MNTAPPTISPRSHEAREFSDWHERAIEHLIVHSGNTVKREPLILGKTPDLLVQPQNGSPFIVECIACLQDQTHAADLSGRGRHTCDGNIRELHQNIYSRLDHKATKYRHIAETMPYIIALYDATCMNSLDCAFDMALSPYAPTYSRHPDGQIAGKRCNGLWSTPAIPAALFELYPHLSGLIYSRWPREHYYLPNPHATQPVPAEALSFAQVPPAPPEYRASYWRPQAATTRDDSVPPPEKWLEQMELLSVALAAD